MVGSGAEHTVLLLITINHYLDISCALSTCISYLYVLYASNACYRKVHY